jgi:hypothetical protein
VVVTGSTDYKAVAADLIVTMGECHVSCGVWWDILENKRYETYQYYIGIHKNYGK